LWRATIIARHYKRFIWRDFEECQTDRIRKELLGAGIVLEDTAQGTTWRRT